MKKEQDIEENETPTIFSVREEKVTLEQAACWQCDLITDIDRLITKRL